MFFLKKLLSLIVILNCILIVPPTLSQNNDNIIISRIQYTEKEITELSEIPLLVTKDKKRDEVFKHKVDELIDLLEVHKKAAEQGQDIDRLQEKVIEINQLLEEQKAGPPKISVIEFHHSICFKCHTVNDFSPKDKTQKQWRRLIEDDGHAIFKNISWETPDQKSQILEFLLDNAGSYRAEGIGLWN